MVLRPLAHKDKGDVSGVPLSDFPNKKQISGWVVFSAPYTKSCYMECVKSIVQGRGHNTALRRRIVKIYDGAQRIVEISDAI